MYKGSNSTSFPSLVSRVNSTEANSFLKSRPHDKELHHSMKQTGIHESKYNIIFSKEAGGGAFIRADACILINIVF